MPNSVPAAPESGEFPLSVTVARQIDLLCDAFERQWRAGGPPDVAAFLAQLPAATAALRVELAAVELEMRCLSSQTVPSAELAARFSIPITTIELWLQKLHEQALPQPYAAAATSALQPESTSTLPPTLSAKSPGREQSELPAQLDVAELKLPCRLGEYELLERLGQGGMGAVYRARHVRLGKPAAAKVVRPDHLCSHEALARFEREMRIVGQLNHPHLVAAHYAGEYEGRLFLAMEFLDGTDLSRLSKEAGPLRPADACELARQAAAGLHYVHESGLVHRDFKPSNLLLTHDGIVKILDLGLARVMATSHEGIDLTGGGRTLGTIDYMAPEQQQDASQAMAAADLYSLGCTLYHLLVGRPPFGHRKSYADKLVAHRLEPAPDMRVLRPDISDALAAMVKRLLAKVPADRFPDARAVARALAPLSAGADLHALRQAAAGEDGLPSGDRPGGAALASPFTTPVEVAESTVSTGPNVRQYGRRVGHLPLAVAALAIGAAVVAGLWWSLPGPQTNSRRGQAKDGLVAPLTIPTLRVQHFADHGDTVQPCGTIGLQSFSTRFGDHVGVSVELSEPAFYYLLALNPNGEIQLCWPGDEQTRPHRSDRLDFPAAGKAFDLTDERRGGLQAFVAIASRQALPPFREWRQSVANLRWQRLPAQAGVVWWGNGERLDPVLQGEGQRGTVSDLPGIVPLLEVIHAVRGAAGIEAVAVCAFAVEPSP
jgi:tRNA A-37 threonylcarbamoyl transferase component Bud32